MEKPSLSSPRSMPRRVCARWRGYTAVRHGAPSFLWVPQSAVDSTSARAARSVGRAADRTTPPHQGSIKCTD
eukprot:gene19198-biopygen19031